MAENDNPSSAEMLKIATARVSSQRVTIAERDDEIRRLKKALRRAELKGTFPDEYEYYFEDDDDSDAEVKDEEDDELDDESSNEAPAAIFDREDDVFRCVSCTFEVVDGFCQSCATMHQYYGDTSRRENMEHVYSSVSTEHTHVHPDRHIAPRGTTPHLPVTESDNFVLPGYPVEEYFELRSRGATRAMIQQFDMGFSDLEGITAWADSTIFEEFSGYDMLPGHKWRIHLGRCLQLEPDDLDGSIFIEDLLEEITVAPRWWETLCTTESDETLWVTKPSTDLNLKSTTSDSNDEEYDIEAWRYSSEPDEFEEADEEGISVGKVLRMREARVADAPIRLPTEYLEDEDENSGEEDAIMDEIDTGFESDTDWSARDPSTDEEGVADESTVPKGAVEAEDIEMNNASDTESTGDNPGSDWESNDADV